MATSVKLRCFDVIYTCIMHFGLNIHVCMHAHNRYTASTLWFALEGFDWPSPTLKPEQVSSVNRWHRHCTTTPTNIIHIRRTRHKRMHIQCALGTLFPSLSHQGTRLECDVTMLKLQAYIHMSLITTCTLCTNIVELRNNKQQVRALILRANTQLFTPLREYVITSNPVGSLDKKCGCSFFATSVTNVLRILQSINP